MARIIGFPNPVNEKAARTVAAGVLTVSVAALVLSTTASRSWLWLVAVLAAGFVARVLTGPRLSPLGQFATKIVAPRLGKPKLVPGPPKRFAQGIGSVLTLVGVLLLLIGHPALTEAVLMLTIFAAGLESIFAYCIGCKIFSALMRLGLIPEKTCAACGNLALRGV